MEQQGLLLVISGPSGSGKGTICSHLVRDPSFALSVSATTRAMRPGETPDVSYHFITREAFEALLVQDGFLEYNRYATGDMYGTLKEETEKALAAGKNLILEIDVNGGRQIRERFPDAVLIMIAPPSLTELEQRLRSRGTETEASIRKRLQIAKDELAHSADYDYLIVNHSGEDGIAQAVASVFSIARAERCKPSRQTGLLDRLRES